MLKSVQPSTLSAGRRIAFWFLSLLIAVVLFSLLLTLLLTVSGSATFGLVVSIFRITMMCALPVWCLCLPIVLVLKNAEGWRTWAILLSGTLIGPFLMGLWFLLLQLGGAKPEMVWQGDPLVGWAAGGIAGMFFALIVGLLATSMYLMAIKALHR